MSDEDIEAFKRIFIMFDKVLILKKMNLTKNDFGNHQDGDGTVSTKELGAVLRSLGVFEFIRDS